MSWKSVGHLRAYVGPPATEGRHLTDEWTQAYIEGQLGQGGSALWRYLASATFEEALVVVVEASVDDRPGLLAFNFETFDDGERVESGRRFISPLNDRQPLAPELQPWTAFDAWDDTNPEYQVVVGRARDESATMCKVIYTDRTDSIPVRQGVVIGWVDTARKAFYRLT